MKEFYLNIIVSELFAENTFVAHSGKNRECLLVDPGFEPEKIIEFLQREGLTPAAILITHGHADHIGGNGAIKQRWPECQLIIGQLDAPKLTDSMLNLSAPFGMATTSPAADILVADGENRDIVGFEVEVLLTPGHSAGHVVYVLKNTTPWRVFCGDVIFRGNIGRTDFPDGSFEQLRQSIHTRLFTLPDDTILLSGHGPPTTVGEEKQSNPMVGAPAGYTHFA